MDYLQFTDAAAMVETLERVFDDDGGNAALGPIVYGDETLYERMDRLEDALRAAVARFDAIRSARARYGATGFPVNLYHPDPTTWMENTAEFAMDDALKALSWKGET